MRLLVARKNKDDSNCLRGSQQKQNEAYLFPRLIVAYLLENSASSNCLPIRDKTSRSESRNFSQLENTL